MIVLVLNVGSTTLKFALIDTESGERLSEGTIDQIGQPDRQEGKTNGVADHFSAAAKVLAQHADRGVQAIGHRIVQGGDRFRGATLVTQESLAKLAPLDALAPLHNPSARAVVEAIDRNLADVPQVMVFDTAYFADLPMHSQRYALNESWYRDWSIRRYGAHGTSHQYVTQRAIAFGNHRDLPSSVRTDSMDAKTPHRIISLHLGGGASATASIDGVAVDTSMGMTPLEGLVMATRCGDLDPSIPLYLIRQAGLSADQVDRVLNKESGLLGMCGHADMRTVIQRCQAGDAQSQLAIDIYLHRLIKMVGGYVAVLGGLDTLVFTAGVGENSSDIRRWVTDRLGYLGLAIDPTKNEERSQGDAILDLTAESSPVQTLVVPTDEEKAIAIQTAQLIAAR